MVGIRAGLLRHQLELQRKTRSRNASGGWTKTSTTIATVWGSMEPVSGNELVEAKKQGWDVTHKARIRHYEGLTPEWRIVFDSRDFEIVSVLNIEERGIVDEIMCKELSSG